MFPEADSASVYSERASEFPDAQYTQRFPHVPAAKPWAGDGEMQGVPVMLDPSLGPFVVTPQTPSMYDPEGIMQNAFEEASYAHLTGWDLGLNSSQPSQLRGADNWDCLQEYSRGLQAYSCRPGDSNQLFNYSPLPVN